MEQDELLKRVDGNVYRVLERHFGIDTLQGMVTKPASAENPYFYEKKGPRITPTAELI